MCVLCIHMGEPNEDTHLLFVITMAQKIVFLHQVHIFSQQPCSRLQQPTMHHLLHFVIQLEDLSTQCVLLLSWSKKHRSLSERELGSSPDVADTNCRRIFAAVRCAARGRPFSCCSTTQVQTACSMSREWLLMTHRHYSCIQSDFLSSLFSTFKYSYVF